MGFMFFWGFYRRRNFKWLDINKEKKKESKYESTAIYHMKRFATKNNNNNNNNKPTHL